MCSPDIRRRSENGLPTEPRSPQYSASNQISTATPQLPGPGPRRSGRREFRQVDRLWEKRLAACPETHRPARGTRSIGVSTQRWLSPSRRSAGVSTTQRRSGRRRAPAIWGSPMAEVHRARSVRVTYPTFAGGRIPGSSGPGLRHGATRTHLVDLGATRRARQARAQLTGSSSPYIAASSAMGRRI